MTLKLSAVEFEDKIMSDPKEIDCIFTDHVQILDHVKDRIRSVFNQIINAECYTRKFSTLNKINK